MKPAMIYGIIAVVVVILVILVARYYKNEEFAPASSMNDGNDTQIVENFPTTAQNVLISDVNGNLSVTSNLGLQNLTVSGESRMGDVIANGNRIAANIGANWGMLWGDSCALIGKKGANIRFGVATDINAANWDEYANFDTGGSFNLNHGSFNVNGKLKEGGKELIPKGTIVMFNGAAPAGWAICDGTNGTPDLRNRFIVGAGASYGVGATGGADTVTLTEAQMPKHTHGYYGMNGGYNRCDNDDEQRCSPDGYNGTTNSAGGDQPHENRPPYYALTYIMKL